MEISPHSSGVSQLAQAAAEGLRAAWEHRWESLGSALEGVTEAEAAHQDPCYREEKREEGWPLPGTILWQVAHVAHGKWYYASLRDEDGGLRLPNGMTVPELLAHQVRHDTWHAAQIAVARRPHRTRSRGSS